MQYGTLCNMVLMSQWRKCCEGTLELLHCACIWCRQTFIYMLVLGFAILILCTLRNAKYFVYGQIRLTKCAWILLKALKWISSQSVLHKLSIRGSYLHVCISYFWTYTLFTLKGIFQRKMRTPFPVTFMFFYGTQKKVFWRMFQMFLAIQWVNRVH